MNRSSNRFLLISPDFPPPLVGGSLVWLNNLIENCPEKFDVLTGSRDNKYKEVLSNPNRVFRSTFIKDSHDPNKIQLFITYFYLPVWLILKNFKEKYSAVIVNPGVIGNSILFIIGRIFRIKIIGIGHGEEITIPLYGKGIKNFIKRKIMQICYKKASGFIVVCHFCRRLLVSLNVNEEKIDVIPSCLNPKKISRVNNNKKKKYKIISVGRLIERKGFHFLIDSVVSLKKDFPEIQLSIVGNGPYKEFLIEKLKKTDSTSYIKLEGQVSDQKLIDLYQEASLFVLAHTLLDNGDTEGCPTVFSEAMGHGLPVIGGTGAGADTAIVEGKNGYIVNSKNNKELSAAIKKILSNPKLADSMSKAGAKKLNLNHDPKKNGIAFQKSIIRFSKNLPASEDQKNFNLQLEIPEFHNN